MTKRCIYCSCEISKDIPIDICQRCGVGVWGLKMFNAIISNVKNEKEKGNMELGCVGEKEFLEMEEIEAKPETFVEKEIISAHHEIKKIDELNTIPEPIAVTETIEQFSESEIDIDENLLDF
jgi:hypothetical protein